MSDWDEDDGPDYAADRDAAVVWARGLLRERDFVIFDTETSGLGFAEILQLGLLSATGEVLIDTKVKPDWTGFANGGGIEAGALATHGITEKSLQNAPPLSEILPTLAQAVTGKQIVVYNADFDRNILCGCLSRRGLRQDFGPELLDTPFEWMARPFWPCAMHWYSQFVGDWHDYFGNYRWQKLPGGDHTAIGDCRATFRVMERMAAAKLSTEG